MGFYVLKVTCDRCPFEGHARLGPSGCHYQLPDGSRADLYSTVAWCADCRTVVDAETFASLEDAVHALHDFESGGLSKQRYVRDIAGFRGDVYDSMVDRQVTSLRATAAWRALRIAPPRCLACGSVRVTSFDRNANGDFLGIQHVDCGGLLTVEVYAHAAGIPRGQHYSVEGERLPDTGH